MSNAEIMAEIPKLSHQERREIMRVIFQTEQDADTLAECDRLALERFQVLDAMEAEDERKQNPPRSGAWTSGWRPRSGPR